MCQSSHLPFPGESDSDQLDFRDAQDAQAIVHCHDDHLNAGSGLAR